MPGLPVTAILAAQLPLRAALPAGGLGPGEGEDGHRPGHQNLIGGRCGARTFLQHHGHPRRLGPCHEGGPSSAPRSWSGRIGEKPGCRPPALVMPPQHLILAAPVPLPKPLPSSASYPLSDPSVGGALPGPSEPPLE